MFRDNFLFENWSRAKLERLTNLCRKKVYEAGELIYKQVDTFNRGGYLNINKVVMKESRMDIKMLM